MKKLIAVAVAALFFSCNKESCDMWNTKYFCASGCITERTGYEQVCDPSVHAGSKVCVDGCNTSDAIYKVYTSRR